LFVSPSAVMQLGWATTKVAKPIRVQLTQGAATLVSKLMLGVVLECGNAKFMKNVMVYTFDGIEAILRNTFLDVYHANVLKGGYKLRIIIGLANRFVKSKVEY